VKPQRYILNANDDNRDHVRANAQGFIDRLPSDKSWQIEVREWHKPRSGQQRKALFAAAYGAIMEATGLQGEREKNQLHEYMCMEFWGSKPGVMPGMVVPVRTTTTNERGERDEIDAATAIEFYEFIQRKGAECGIDVPDPDPFWREHRK